MDTDFFPKISSYDTAEEIRDFLLANPKAKVVWINGDAETTERSGIGGDIRAWFGMQLESFFHDNSDNNFNRHFDHESDTPDYNRDLFLLVPHRFQDQYDLYLKFQNDAFENFKKTKPESVYCNTVNFQKFFESLNIFKTDEEWSPSNTTKENVLYALEEFLNVAKQIKHDIHKRSNQLEENAIEKKFSEELKQIIEILDTLYAEINDDGIKADKIIEVPVRITKKIETFIRNTHHICNEVDRVKNSPTGAFALSSLGTALLCFLGVPPSTSLATSLTFFKKK